MAISADNPIPGFYKMKRGREAKWLPVAIWRKDDQLLCRVGPDTAEAMDVWTYCAGNKVTNIAAKFAFEHGYWEDEQPPSQLSNLPADPFERLQLEIKEKEERAARLLDHHPEIKNQEVANLFRNTQADLLALNKQADVLFEAEKKPHLEAGRKVDEKFRFRATVKVLSERLRSRFESFLKADEAKKIAEAEAKFQAEQAKLLAERKKLEDERARRLRDDPVAALTETLPPMPELPLGPEPVRVQAGGGVGKKAGLRDVWVGTVTDYSAAALYFVEHPLLKEVVDKLVAHQVRDLKSSTVIPGVKVTKDRKAA